MIQTIFLLKINWWITLAAIVVFASLIAGVVLWLASKRSKDIPDDL